MKVTLSKKQWKFIGRKAGWIKAAQVSDSIVADYVPTRNPDDESDPRALVYCPSCGSILSSDDIEIYYKQSDQNKSIEICNGCRENFEHDEGIQQYNADRGPGPFDSDVLDDAVFAKLWDYVVANRAKLNIK